MNFEYSKTREQKKEMIKKEIEKKHKFTKEQKTNQFIIDKKNNMVVSNLGMNQLHVNKNIEIFQNSSNKELQKRMNSDTEK